MAEFQDAAKVITESIDKDARVIIGTILDERIKKGEIKITVIATGFPSDGAKKGTLFANNRELFNRQDQPRAPQPQQSQQQEEAPMIQKPELRPSESELSDEAIEDDLDNFGAIPAFLRRNKK
jgi:cell division protein FtsZ